MNKLLKILIVFILIVGLTGCYNNRNNDDELKNKVVAEIKYLDSNITSIINTMNNISFQNYKVTTRQIEEGSNSGSLKDKESGENNQSKINVYEMGKTNLINSQDNTIDWNEVDEKIEDIYTAWNTTIIDLNSIGANSNDIEEFSKVLDKITISVKKENKKESIQGLAELYQYVPKFLNQTNENSGAKSLKSVKSNLIASCSFVEDDDWENVKKNIDSAEQILKNIDEEFKTTYDFNIEKIKVTLLELKNSIDLKNKTIFYIKYRNLLQELEVL